MLYMNELTSTEFRRSYHRLVEPAVVTVNGHVIGQWLPNGFFPTFISEFGDDVLDQPLLNKLEAAGVPVDRVYRSR